MQGEISIWQQPHGNEEAKVFTLKPRDRILTPKGEEYSIRWNPVREAIEFVKTYSDEDQSITITPSVSNFIYIS